MGFTKATNETKATEGIIKDITDAPLKRSVEIIRSAFGKVAPELGITKANAPMFPAFITIGRLEEMKSHGAKFFGAFIGRRQVGVVAVKKRDNGNYYMERLAVIPEYWHGGIGRQLVNHVIDYAKKLGVKKLYLGMVNEHKVLKEWYRSMGFREIEVRKFEYLPFRVCFMEMDIQ
jgi:diamine N-acetyltransferase